MQLLGQLGNGEDNGRGRGDVVNLNMAIRPKLVLEYHHGKSNPCIALADFDHLLDHLVLAPDWEPGLDNLDKYLTTYLRSMERVSALHRLMALSIALLQAL